MVMRLYFVVLLPIIYFSEHSTAAVVTLPNGEEESHSPDELGPEIKRLHDMLHEMDSWKDVILEELNALRGAHSGAEELEKHRTRRETPAQIPACTPGTFGCPVQVTPYVVPSGSCVLCPAGNSGPPGPAGPPGRDGRDAIAVVTSSGDANSPCFSQATPGSQPPTETGGAVYIRWGHRECPSTSELIYTGTGASSNHLTSGGGVDQLCLPGNPVYDAPIAGVGSSRAFLYGLEYQTYEMENKHWHDIPCAVCKAASRYAKLMMPGTNECPSSDWTREYGGYLMAERTHSAHHRSLHICVDREMQVVPRTSGALNDNSRGLMNFVEARCSTTGGGIPCAPYIEGYEITCAVCTQ